MDSAQSQAPGNASTAESGAGAVAEETQAALRNSWGEESSRVLAAIVESSSDAIIGKTLEGIVTSWNRAAERIYGYSAAEAIGRQISFLAPPERAEEMARILERLRRGERIEHFETIRVHKSGRRIQISLSVSPILDDSGKVVGAAAIARDITERKLAEEILQGQLQLLELVAKSVPLSTVLTRIIETIEAYSRDEVLASILLLDDDGKTLRTGAAPSLPEAYNEAVDGIKSGPKVGSCGTAAFRREQVVVSDIANDPLWEDFVELALEHGLRACWSTPILSTTGEVLGTFAMYYRQPRQPSAQDQILHSIFARTAAIALENHRLQEAARRRANELAAANRRKSQFLAVLAHELRNPLGAISNALALAEAADGEVVQRALGIVRRQGDHMARLVDDLLDVSRIGRGILELQRRPIDLREVAEQAIESVRPQIESRNQRLIVELGSRAIELEADPVRLKQVIVNLLSNANKYSPEESRIWLQAECGSGQALLRVCDEGIGIEPELLPNVFDLFMQGGERSSQGLGVGLTLVRRLIELHGGLVEAESDGPGRGSEFRIRLPLSAAGRVEAQSGRVDEAKTRDETAETASEELDVADAIVGPAAPPSQTEAALREARATEENVSEPPLKLEPESSTSPAPNGDGKLRVLVVDDHEEAVTALQTLLELWGHDVRAALDGQSALDAARRFHPELVLLDIGLPGMDGWEVARRMRKQPESTGAVLVALTGFGQEADRQRSRQAGFDHHLVKPVDPGQLERSLSEWTADR